MSIERDSDTPPLFFIIEVTECLCEVAAHTVDECLHGGRVASGHYVAQMGEVVDDEVEFLGREGVEKDFRKKEIVLAHEPAGYGHVALECGAGCVLMLHHRSESEGGSERDAQ